MVSPEGITVDPGKLKEVLDWKLWTYVSEVWCFLGLAGYCGRFIPNFSKIAKPITEILKKENKYISNDACEEAFKDLKKLMTTSPMLTQPDIAKLFDVYCDASSTGLGGVLMQEGWVISYSLLAFLSYRIIYMCTDANCSLHPGVLQGIKSIGKQ
jgi:hypothetical protein